MKMTPQEAIQFEQKSDGNADIIRKAARERGCSCEPYVDWFTFDRWIAQEKCVNKGEKGTRLFILKNRMVEDKQKPDGSKKEIRTSCRVYVFCRCQVKDLSESKAVAELTPAEAPFVTEVDPNFAKRLSLVEI